MYIYKGLVFINPYGNTYTVWFHEQELKTVKKEDWPGEYWLDYYHCRHKKFPWASHRPMCIVKTKA